MTKKLDSNLKVEVKKITGDEVLKTKNYGPNDLFYNLKIPDFCNKSDEKKFLKQVTHYLEEKHKEQLKNGGRIIIGVLK